MVPKRVLDRVRAWGQEAAWMWAVIASFTKAPCVNGPMCPAPSIIWTRPAGRAAPSRATMRRAAAGDRTPLRNKEGAVTAA